MLYRRLVLPLLAGTLVLVGCAPAVDGEDEAVASDDAELVAFEQRVGFDGAIERLLADEDALARIDADARRLEETGADRGSVERAASRSVLVEAKSKTSKASKAGVQTSSLQPLGVYDNDLFKLNGLERTICKKARLDCVRVMLTAVRARSASQAAYRDGNVGGRIDAFRHTYWNAAMARSVGTARAKEWADAHENGYPENRATKADRLLSDMDFHNNDQGRKIGARLDDASDGEVKDAVKKAIAEGTVRAVRYDKGDADGVMVPASECSEQIHCGR